jgi:hypothetical protein
LSTSWPQLDASAQRRGPWDEQFGEERVEGNEWIQSLFDLKTEQAPYLIEEQVNLLLNVGPEVMRDCARLLSTERRRQEPTAVPETRSPRGLHSCICGLLLVVSDGDLMGASAQLGLELLSLLSP